MGLTKCVLIKHKIVNGIKTSGACKVRIHMVVNRIITVGHLQSADRDNLKTLNIELKLGRDKAHEIDLMRR